MPPSPPVVFAARIRLRVGAPLRADISGLRFCPRGDGGRLFLSEHHGDAQPDTLVYLRVPDVSEVAREFDTKIVEQPWSREVHLVDPDGNRVRVGSPRVAEAPPVTVRIAAPVCCTTTAQRSISNGPGDSPASFRYGWVRCGGGGGPLIARAFVWDDGHVTESASSYSAAREIAAGRGVHGSRNARSRLLAPCSPISPEQLSDFVSGPGVHTAQCGCASTGAGTAALSGAHTVPAGVGGARPTRIETAESGGTRWGSENASEITGPARHGRVRQH